MIIFESFSQEDTKEFGYSMGKKAAAGQVYCLIGDLAAGKTAFARGFAAALDIKEYITSPTFGIINIYSGTMPLYHFDVYRINHIIEMQELGYEEYFYGDGISLVEWADIIKELLPPDAIYIYFERDASRGQDYRKIKVTP